MPPELEPILKDPGVIEAMIGVIIAVLTAVTGLLGFGVKKLKDLQKLSTETSEQVAVTKAQVTNSHDTNLRDDLTELKELVTEGFTRMDRQFGETRRSLSQEIEERQHLDRRAQEDHQRLWEAIRESKD